MATSLITHNESAVSTNVQPQDEPVRISDRAKRMLEKSRDATDTIKVYQSSYNVFARWLNHHGIPESSVAAGDLINFLADQFEGVLTRVRPGTKTKPPRLVDGGQIAIATLELRRWGIIKVLNHMGIFFTAKETMAIKDFMKSLRMQDEQTNPDRKRGQAAPLMPADVDRMLNCPDIMNASKFRRLRDRALISLFRTTGARESELLGKNGLRLTDLTFKDGVITVKRLALKKGSRIRDDINTILPDDTVNCPVAAIKAYFEVVRKLPGIQPTNALFIKCSTRGDHIKYTGDAYPALPSNKMDETIRKWACSAGLFEAHYSGHSFRVGLVIYMLENGATAMRIAEITKQSEATVMKYGRHRRTAGYSGK